MKWVIGLLVVGALAYYIYTSTIPASGAGGKGPPSTNPNPGGANNTPDPTVYNPAPWHLGPQVSPPTYDQWLNNNGLPAHQSDGTPTPVNMPSIGVIPSVLVGPRSLAIPTSQILAAQAKPAPRNNVYQAIQLGPVPTKA